MAESWRSVLNTLNSESSWPKAEKVSEAMSSSSDLLESLAFADDQLLDRLLQQVAVGREVLQHFHGAALVHHEATRSAVAICERRNFCAA